MSALQNARSAWGDVPDWVETLALACDRNSQNAVARRLGYSGALVSLVIRRRYGGSLTAVERTVRATLMAVTVACPVVGDLAADVCDAHQRAPWAPSPGRIAFYRACRNGCPHATLIEEDRS